MVSSVISNPVARIDAQAVRPRLDGQAESPLCFEITVGTFKTVIPIKQTDLAVASAKFHALEQQCGDDLKSINLQDVLAEKIAGQPVEIDPNNPDFLALRTICQNALVSEHVSHIDFASHPLNSRGNANIFSSIPTSPRIDVISGWTDEELINYLVNNLGLQILQAERLKRFYRSLLLIKFFDKTKTFVEDKENTLAMPPNEDDQRKAIREKKLAALKRWKAELDLITPSALLAMRLALLMGEEQPIASEQDLTVIENMIRTQTAGCPTHRKLTHFLQKVPDTTLTDDEKNFAKQAVLLRKMKRHQFLPQARKWGISTGDPAVFLYGRLAHDYDQPGADDIFLNSLPYLRDLEQDGQEYRKIVTKILTDAKNFSETPNAMS